MPSSATKRSFRTRDVSVVLEQVLGSDSFDESDFSELEDSDDLSDSCSEPENDTQNNSNSDSEPDDSEDALTLKWSSRPTIPRQKHAFTGSPGRNFYSIMVAGQCHV